MVANAHMHWDPEFSDVKLIQTMMFLSELKSIAERAATSLTSDPATIPIVLCADLNSLPDSGRRSPPPFRTELEPPYHLSVEKENTENTTLPRIVCVEYCRTNL